jgi:hypothetical protein
MLSWLQQNPIVVDLGSQPPPARDASIDAVLGTFALAGVFLAVAAVGAAIVAGAIYVYKRRSEATSSGVEPTHTRLRL